jgi:hypothetical protein
MRLPPSPLRLQDPNSLPGPVHVAQLQALSAVLPRLRYSSWGLLPSEGDWGDGLRAGNLRKYMVLWRRMGSYRQNWRRLIVYLHSLKNRSTSRKEKESRFTSSRWWPTCAGLSSSVSLIDKALSAAQLTALHRRYHPHNSSLLPHPRHILESSSSTIVLRSWLET